VRDDGGGMGLYAGGGEEGRILESFEMRRRKRERGDRKGQCTGRFPGGVNRKEEIKIGFYDSDKSYKN